MKKSILLFLVSILFLSAWAKDKNMEERAIKVIDPFTRGFEDGYVEGYCYDIFGCIEPIVPIAPIPKIGESYDSYRDGYNRGFKTGYNDNH